MTIDTEKYTRKDTAANWTSSNTVLPSGIYGIESDTGKMKRGDGVTGWASIAYSALDDMPIDPTVPAGLEKFTNAAGAIPAIYTGVTVVGTTNGVIPKIGAAGLSLADSSLVCSPTTLQWAVAAKADVQGSGLAISAANTNGFSVYSDDAGVSIAAGDTKGFISRYLTTIALTGNGSIAGIQGQAKFLGVSIGGTGTKCGVKGYIETLTGMTFAAGHFGAVVGCLDAVSGSTVAASVYPAAFCALSNDNSATKTGKTVIIDVPACGAGSWDAFAHLISTSGVTGTTYGSIDANKCIHVYYNDTLMSIPLYASA